MSDSDELGSEEDFVDDAIDDDDGSDDDDESDDDDGSDDDDVSPDDQLLLDRKELHELGLELDNPDGFADE